MSSIVRSALLCAAAALFLVVPGAAHASGLATAGSHAPSPARASFDPGPLAPASFDPGPPQYPNVARESDVPIEMRDGVTLYADIYRPADASGNPVPGRFPVVLNQVVFNKNLSALDGTPAGGSEQRTVAHSPLFVKHGYVQVIVDQRGTGSASGDWSIWGRDVQQDEYDVARWVHTQPFSDGNLVAWGPSCMAISQLFMAAQRPPGLKALFTIFPIEDAYRDVVYHGGGLNLPFLAIWHGLVGSTSALPPGYAARDPQAAVEMMSSRATGTSATAMATRPYDGDYYRERAPGNVLDQIDVPTFVVGGWFDLMQRGAPRVYDQLPLEPGRKQLLIGPWYHATVDRGLGEPGAPPLLEVLALAWFDRWVKGERNGIEDYGPVTLAQLGTERDGGGERWETYRSYPRGDVSYERLYLSGEQSGSARSLNDGSLTSEPPAAPGADSMPGNGVNGVCTRSATTSGVGLVPPPGQPCETDHRANEATSLTYTTEPLERPLHVSGPLSLTLNGSTTARDTTWVVTVSDVAPDGTSTALTSGWLIHSRRALDPSRTTFAPNGDPIVPFHHFTREAVLPVVPGAKDELAIEVFNTDAVIEAGHRLRVTIGSADVPHMLVPPDVAVNGAGGIATVHRGGDSPSFLTMPVAPLGPES